MKVKQNVNLHNRFDIEVRNIETEEIKKYVAHNIVLDQMWTRLCGGNTYFVNIHFGTGLGTPAASRTSLFTHLGTKAAVNEELIKAVPVSIWKRKIVLAPEEYVGSTITEVGIAFGGTASNLVTHAMLKDSEGNTISITKSSTDVVTIYATVFITISNNVPELMLLDIPNNNALINYLTGGSAPTGSFGLTEIQNGFNRLGSTAAVSWISDVSNKQRKTNIPRFGINDANGNVKALEFSSLFTLVLPANGIFTGQPYAGVPLGVGDGVNNLFSIPSANVRQSSVAIKVNGVIENTITKKITRGLSARRANPSSLPGTAAYGVALTPDGLVMALSLFNASPFIATYDWTGSEWIRRPTPSSPPGTGAYGVALTPDGLVMAVAFSPSPFIATYDWTGSEWIRRPNPSSLPGAGSQGVALTPDGLVMAVSSNSSPYIATYDWTGSDWARRADPSSLPGADARGVALTSDGLGMAVVSYASPYIATYDWTGSEWIRRANPSSLPAAGARGVALTPDGLVMAVASYASPYIATYDWTGSEWIRRANPSSLPTAGVYGAALTPDGLVMAVASSSSPFIVTYDWTGSEWIRRPNPSSIPGADVQGVALTPDGLVMAAASYTSPYIVTYDNMPITHIEFQTPPAVGSIITADYIVDGIHKTNQYVIDVSFAIQFGEGV